MTLTVQLPDDVASRLQNEAARRGVDLDHCAAQIIREHLPAEERAKAARELFSLWEAEDATDDPAEIAARQAEWEELKRNLNANRTSGRKLFPE
jgi:hypothetical protein